jgi:hypothetical protein
MWTEEASKGEIKARLKARYPLIMDEAAWGAVF